MTSCGPVNCGSNAPILVTGATGLVGNNVVRLLVERGAAVRVLTRSASDGRPLEGLGVQIVVGDVLDEESLARAAESVSGVVHAAGCVLIGWHNAGLLDRVNHIGARNVARAARAAGARMVHVSTINTLGAGLRDRLADEQWVARPNVACQYVVSKRAGERAVEAEMEQGLDAVIVHPGLMFGPWDWKPSSSKMLLQVVRRFRPFSPSGGCAVGDVRDVAAAIVGALEVAPASRRYVLGGHNLTYLELWRMMAEVAGRRGPWCRCGPAIPYLLGQAGDLWGRLTGHEPDVNSAVVTLSRCFHYFSSARAERELGFRVRPAEETMADTWQWLREFGYA
ncbi:MAG: NAD-dependent epimerase/dehydratase family protein [Planctomycetes bacterium]|nr:NAD-dependent epimerase/dehydratase family protein [Planctomycetota bacterium]